MSFRISFEVIGTCSLDGHVRIFDVNKFTLKEKWNMDVKLIPLCIFLTQIRSGWTDWTTTKTKTYLSPLLLMEECSYSITDSRILLQRSIAMPLAFKISRFSRTINHHETPEINTFIYLDPERLFLQTTTAKFMFTMQEHKRNMQLLRLSLRLKSNQKRRKLIFLKKICQR